MFARRSESSDRPTGEAVLRERVAACLDEHTTLVLATAGADGVPAAAALFYAADQQLNLYFLSEEHTDHVRNLLERPLVSAAVQRDGQDWRSIHGLQIRGSARPVSLAEWPRAAAVYARRFSFVESILTGGQSPLSLAGPLARARFYVLQPSWIRLIDNRVSFGHKEELRLGAPDTEG